MRPASVGQWLSVAGALLLLTTHPAAGQERTPSVRVLQSVGPPGGEVAVSVHVASGGGEGLRSFTLELQFPTRELTFDRVEMGGLGDEVGAEANTEAKQRNAETLLRVTISTPEKDGAAEPLPDGPVAQLMFKIAKHVKAKEVIPVDLDVAVLGVGPESKPVQLPAQKAEVIASDPLMTVFGCFFYMH